MGTTGDVTRRDALLALTGGAAAGALGLPAARAGVPSEAPRDGAPGPVREGARLTSPSPARGGDATVGWARVLLCRSWDRHVYLEVHRGAPSGRPDGNERLRGVVLTTAEGFAIAAACQAAGRPVAAEVWGHEPEWAGTGRFAGALLAMDLADLPGGALAES